MVIRSKRITHKIQSSEQDLHCCALSVLHIPDYLDKAIKNTFARRLVSSCGWSLTTSPSC